MRKWKRRALAAESRLREHRTSTIDLEVWIDGELVASYGVRAYMLASARGLGEPIVMAYGHGSRFVIDAPLIVEMKVHDE